MKIFILTIITLFFSINLFSQCEERGNLWNESWVSCTKSTNPNPLRGQSHWLLYEFHELQFLDSTHIWNANRQGESGWGAKELIVDYSEDGTTWKEVGQYNLQRGDETDNYEGIPGPNLKGLEMTKLLITIISTHETGNCASLAEVFLSVDEEACSGTIDVCGICDGPGELNWYLDADDDGMGDPNTIITACDQPQGYVSGNTDLCDNGALGWEEIGPLFRDNGCNNCHGQGSAGGLDLRTYDSTVRGGNSCGSTILTGEIFVEVITTTAYNGCGNPFGPSMNARSSGEFDAEELDLLQRWIDGNFPESCTEFQFSIDLDGDGYTAAEDCDDNNSEINPGVTEITYNGIDDDCNSETLDDDLDQDGFLLTEDCDDNNPNINPDQTEITYNGIDDDCNASTLDDDLDQDGFLLTEDCDDNNPNINPDQTEITYNGIDDDCNSETLDDDLDQDGFLLTEDCNDNNPNINPDQTEITYNGIDDDCNSETLDDDLDQDGFLLTEDCDDNNPNINPDQTEITYNGIDDDCNSETLDDDLDQDGFLLTEDCDDNNPNINPDQTEITYNGIDDDCNSETLDDDLDQDGFLIADDCDDNNPDINPDAEEIPNNDIDEDCDGMDLISSTHQLSNASVNIFPNPASDVINIKVEGKLDFEATLYDLDGRTINTIKNLPQFKTHTLTSGIYLLEIRDLDSGRRIAERIILEK